MIRLDYLCTAITLLEICVTVRSELFTSIHDMKSLYSAEVKIIPFLEEYVGQEQHRLTKLEQSGPDSAQDTNHGDGDSANIANYILTEYRRLNQIEKRIDEMRDRSHHVYDNITFVGHPVNAFNLIKAWWNPISPDPPGSGVARKVLVEFGIPIPDGEDYSGALDALLRLQHVYNLTTHAIASGIIHGVRSHRQLEPFDYWALGHRAYVMGDYGLATVWLDLVYREHPLHVPMDMALQILADSYQKIGHFNWAAAVAKSRYDANSDSAEAKADLDRLTSDKAEKFGQGLVPQYTPITWRKPDFTDVEKNYEALCRGDNIPKIDSRPGLCRYKRGLLPYVVYKQEIFNHAPFVSIFYDVITDKQIQLVKDAAEHQMQRGTVATGQGNLGQTGVRISKVGWVFDAEEGVANISAKIADITGLETEDKPVRSNSEAFQVVNYGIGGQYGPHFDFFENTDVLTNELESLHDTGHRVATFIFYFQTTTAGGGTVFPDIGVRIPAMKGAAALWYNIKRSGEVDRLTRHAGCPVLLGEKWVTNKWIREFGQMHKHKCCPHPDTEELVAETHCV